MEDFLELTHLKNGLIFKMKKLEISKVSRQYLSLNGQKAYMRKLVIQEALRRKAQTCNLTMKQWIPQTWKRRKDCFVQTALMRNSKGVLTQLHSSCIDASNIVSDKFSILATTPIGILWMMIWIWGVSVLMIAMTMTIMM